jgi:hypothetical protein
MDRGQRLYIYILFELSSTMYIDLDFKSFVYKQHSTIFWVVEPYYHVFLFTWLIIVGSGSDESIYWTFTGRNYN